MVPRRLSILVPVWLVLFAMLSQGTAAAQDDADDETAVEVVYYGDNELIDALRTYGLLDEWIAASPVSAQASLLEITGNSTYQNERQVFLNSLEAWAARTELVRQELARIDAAQADTDALRTAVLAVRDALVFDDRLAEDSETLVVIEDALAQLAQVSIPQHSTVDSQESLTLAELRLADLLPLAESEFKALNAVEPAFINSGVAAFFGFEALRVGLDDVDQLIEQGRGFIRPAREQSEWLVSSALAQIPRLHALRMRASTDVDGLSVVTVDAYIRAAERSSCSVDWAMLAGIAQVESNHGRIDGASVSDSGTVSTRILGPLLDGGETESDSGQQRQSEEDRQAALADAIEASRLALRAAVENSLWRLLRGRAGSGDDVLDGNGPGNQGNGFAVVVDSDGGRLDGNDEWDRAVGPMQFLPETWSKWAVDGNGDGVADPHNLYDAAAAARRFLCGLSEARGSDPSTFLLGYNNSTSYVRRVLSIAADLRATSLPDV